MTILMRVAALVGAALLVLIFNVAATVLYMVVYGHLIDPGHEASYYEKHVQAAGPYCSIVFGIPLMAATGWWVAGWWRREWGLRGPIGVWLAYTVDRSCDPDRCRSDGDDRLVVRRFVLDEAGGDLVGSGPAAGQQAEVPRARFGIERGLREIPRGRMVETLRWEVT
ncbi:MAG TPA: hypothetical protein DCQ98_05665 [Planctomycetaceae bacterium]|nr:hypothetical protein [Planctomycetaceae bacterium]